MNVEVGFTVVHLPRIGMLTAMRKPVVGVMGGGEAASPQAIEWGYELGRLIAERDWVLLSGGRNAGVMDSSCRGAKDAGGLVIGVIPFNHDNEVSDAVDVALITGMGSARNNINVLSSDVVIACGDASAGTLSEIGLAFKAKRNVIFLNNDELSQAFLQRAGGSLLHPVSDPRSAIALVESLLG